MRRLTRIVVLTSVAAATLLTAVAPAGAHATGGIEATNYRTRIDSIEPATPGVEVRVVNVGEQLQLTNTSDADVVVLGYEGEPYLRVGPDGAFRNTRSPSTYRNASRTDTNRIPDTADATADPEWERTGDCCTVRWHDHRAHYMGSSDPPAVQAQPDVRRTVIETWTVDVRLDDGSTMTITGDVEWVPAPSAVPWIVLILLIVGLVAGLSFTRWWPKVLGVALAVAIVIETVHVVGNWTGVEASFGSKFGTAVFAIAAIALGIAALVHLIVRGGEDAAPSVLVAGVALGITGGFADIEAFARSQLPFAFGADLGRGTVAVTIGLSIGLVIGAGMHLRRPAPTPPAPAPLASVPTT